jgi:hypothetical protein
MTRIMRYLVAMLQVCLLATSTYGFGLYSSSGGYATLGGSSADYVRWGDTSGSPIDIRYAATSDAAYLLTYPRYQQLTELVFSDWAQAQDEMSDPTYSYRRLPTDNTFFDYRTLLNKVTGAALGFRDPVSATLVGRNYSYSTIGGPVGNRVATGAEVMVGFQSPGEYNQELSRDEVEGMTWLYGNRVSFTPTTLGNEHLLLDRDTLPSTTLARVALRWSPRSANPADGGQFTHATVTINTQHSIRLGWQARVMNWDVLVDRNLQDTFITTQHSSNPIAIDTFGAGPLGVYEQVVAAAQPGAPRDDLYFHWLNPKQPIQPAPPGQPISRYHIGLQLDVNDWVVPAAFASTPTNANPTVPLALHTIETWVDWNKTGWVPSLKMVAQADSQLQEAVVDIGCDLPEPVARGIQINNGNFTSTLDELILATTTGMDLSLSDLNAGLLAVLESQGRTHHISAFGTRTLNPYERFILLLQGDPTDLPDDVLLTGNWLDLNMPELLDEQLFVFFGSETSGGPSIGNYGLLSGEYMPEPASLVGALFGLTLLAARRRR